MPSVWCGIHIVEDIVNTRFKTVRHRFAFTEIVGGVDAPYLISLTITIGLIIAFRTHTAIYTNPQTIEIAKGMLPSYIRISFMMSRSVDGHFFENILVGIIHMRRVVQIAVANARTPIFMGIAQGHIRTIGFGILHILILSGFLKFVSHLIFRRSLIVRYGYQRNHVVQCVIITTHVEIETIP